eukprot:11425507-Karenia_brevis.AAC.1
MRPGWPLGRAKAQRNSAVSRMIPEVVHLCSQGQEEDTGIIPAAVVVQKHSLGGGALQQPVTNAV